jgi:hypothetical protein
MKTTFTLFLIALFAVGNVKAQDEDPYEMDSLHCLIVKGKVLNAADGADRTCKVEIIDSRGGIATIMLTNGRRNFEVKLQKNEAFVIKISKEGYVSKKIAINTALAVELTDLTEFAFNTELVSLSDAQGMKTNTVNVPVAFIRFDTLTDSFIYDLAYATTVKLDMYCKLDRSLSNDYLQRYGH